MNGSRRHVEGAVGPKVTRPPLFFLLRRCILTPGGVAAGLLCTLMWQALNYVQNSYFFLPRSCSLTLRAAAAGLLAAVPSWAWRASSMLPISGSAWTTPLCARTLAQKRAASLSTWQTPAAGSRSSWRLVGSRCAHQAAGTYLPRTNLNLWQVLWVPRPADCRVLL